MARCNDHVHFQRHEFTGDIRIVFLSPGHPTVLDSETTVTGIYGEYRAAGARRTAGRGHENGIPGRKVHFDVDEKIMVCVLWQVCRTRRTPPPVGSCWSKKAMKPRLLPNICLVLCGRTKAY